MTQSDLDRITATMAERHDEICTAYDHALECHLAGGEPIPDAVRDAYIRSLVDRAIWTKLGGVMLDEPATSREPEPKARSCRDCAHCGRDIGEKIRCCHPAFREDEEATRYTLPTFAELCASYLERKP